RYARGQLPGDLVLDIGVAGAGEDAVPARARLRRGVEVELQAADFFVEVQLAAKAPCLVERVLVAVAQLELRPGVGTVADARFDMLRGRLDDRDAHRRGGRAARVGLELRLHAGEIAGFQQAPLIEEE